MDVKITDEQKRLHNVLLTDINDQVDTSSTEYTAFKLQITKHLGGPGVLGRCNCLFDIFKQLSRRNKLGVLKYDILKTAFKDSNNVDVVALIEEREFEIRHESGDEMKDAGSKRGAEEGQSVSQFKYPRHTSTSVEKDPSDGKYKTIDGLEYYDTDNKTGFLLVLHFYEKRKGLEGDLQKLTDFFETRLGFDTLILPYKEAEIGNKPQFPDLTSGQVTAVLKKVRTYLEKKRKEYYCFLCVILSHGDKGTIKTADSAYKIHDIREIFNNINLEFKGKAKVFIIQACQGEDKQESVECDDQSDSEDQQRRVTPVDLADQPIYLPKDADTLIIFATTPVEKYHTQYHLEDMLITVRDKTSQDELVENSMMPYTWSTLTKRLKLVPGSNRLTGDSSQRFLHVDSNDDVDVYQKYPGGNLKLFKDL